jgi:hypothetical protein
MRQLSLDVLEGKEQMRGRSVDRALALRFPARIETQFLRTAGPHG